MVFNVTACGWIPTALTDRVEESSLVYGCGGSGNNTISNYSHPIVADKQQIIRAQQKRSDTLLEDLVPVATQ